MQTYSPGSDTATAVDSLFGAIHSVGRLLRRRILGGDLDAGSFWLLRTLAKSGPMRVTDLAGCAYLDTSTMSRHVAQLERSGLIDRAPDPADRRAQLVELSDLGRERLHAATARQRELLTDSLRDWPGADIADLVRLLDRFAAAIETTVPLEDR